MALIRGVQALHPCPVCLVNTEEQSDLTITPPRRTTDDSRRAIEKARTLNAEQRETYLNSLGLRNVDVST